MEKTIQNRSNQRYKPWLDMPILIVSSLLLLPIWMILWTVIPFLIWIDNRGPVFYKQQRMGKDRVPFNVIKFRTMVINADQIGPAWTIENDKRITRVGKFLRKTALDELPQIISIARGHMSFVGPRALDSNEQLLFEKLIPGFKHRLQIKPGLTGFAQIYDQSDDPHEKYKYDMDYIQKMNPLLDVKLILLSVWYTLISRWDRRSGKAPIEHNEMISEACPGDQQVLNESKYTDTRKSSP